MYRVLYRFYIIIALIVLTLSFSSCGEKQDCKVLARDFEGEIWNRFDYIEADYNVVKAPMTGDLVMNVCVSDVYPNIYPYHEDDGLFSIVLSLSGPDGSRRVKDYKFNLKDKDGNFKSEKTDGYYNFELPLINEMYFGEKGSYHFMIESKYPKEPLYGIKSLSINCLQNKTK